MMMQKNHALPLILILLLSPLPGMGVDLCVPALVNIYHSLHTTPGIAKLVVSTFLCGYAIGLLFFGIYSDYINRWKALATGVAGYIVITMVMAFSTSIHMLLTLRFLQGLAAAIPGIIFKTMMTDFYQDTQLKKIVSSSIMVWGLGVVLSPFIGGWLTHFFDWRSCFVFMSLYALVCFVFVFFIPRQFNAPAQFSFRHLKQNLSRIIRYRPFLLITVCVGVSYGGLVVFYTFGPFLIEHTLHYSSGFYGSIALILGAAFFIGAMLNRKVFSNTAPNKKIKTLLPIQLVICIAMLFIAKLMPLNLWIIILPQIFIFCFASFFMPSTMGECMQIFPDMAGTANAVMNSFNLLTATICTALASLFQANSLVPLSSFNFVMTFIFILCIAFAWFYAKKMVIPK